MNPELNELEKNIREKISDSMLEVLDIALGRARPVIEDLLKKNLIRTGPEVERDWIIVDSFSRLRKTAGGRFENLRSRWLAAGFPLKESAKELKNEPKLNEEGWLELAAWLLKTGYQTRRGTRAGFFEIRPLREK